MTATQKQLPLGLEPKILASLRPPKRQRVSEWADENRWLDPLFSRESGRWRSSRVPHAREWMDTLNDAWVRELTICAGTQIGKSESINNMIGFSVHHSPRPTMVVVPRSVDAKLVAKRRLLPMFLASPSLRGEMTGRAHDVTGREFVFRRSVLYLRSSQSPADLASTPASLVLCDELDKWPDWSGKEASPLSLVAERQKTFPDSLIVKTSTPTTRDGLIWQEFEQGDQRRYHVPCPHCGAFQVLKWSGVKWDRERIATAKQMRRERDAWYECAECGGRIDDAHRRDMLERGEWVPAGHTLEEWRTLRATDRTDHRSYHIWAGYSPFLTWWRIVAEFLKSVRGGPQHLMNFYNSWLAEVWEDRVDGATDETVAANIDDDLTQSTVPAWVDFVTAAADVQKDRVEWQVQGWGRDEESVVIAHGVAKGEAREQWDEAGNALFRTTWGAKNLRVCTAFVDSRWRRSEVMDFVRRWAPVAKMIAGVDRDMPIPFGTTVVDKHPLTGKKLPNPLTCWTVNVGMFKDLVATRLARTLALQEEGKEPQREGRIHIPADMSEEWLQQMVSEHKVRKRVGNRYKTLWVVRPGNERNEAWDLVVYNTAAARHSLFDRHRSPGNTLARPRRGKPTRSSERRPRSSYPSLGGGS